MTVKADRANGRHRRGVGAGATGTRLEPRAPVLPAGIGSLATETRLQTIPVLWRIPQPVTAAVQALGLSTSGVSNYAPLLIVAGLLAAAFLL